MAPSFGWGSTASRLGPLRVASLLFTTKFPEIPGTHFIDFGRVKGWVDLGGTQLFWRWGPCIGNPAPLPIGIWSKKKRRKTIRTFCSNLLKNHFRHLKFYSNPPSWFARNRCHMTAFWKTKGWNLHFWKGQPFRFCCVGVHHQDLHPWKQVFLLNLRLWPTQKPKTWSIFYEKKFIWENFVV